MEAPFFVGRNGRELAYILGPYNGLYGGSSGWKGYRGGTTPSLMILDPARERLERVDGTRVNDIEPMWAGDDLYFVSDREFEALNVYRYDRSAGTATRMTDERPDVRSADALDGAIVYEAGALKELDLDSGVVREIVVPCRPICRNTSSPRERRRQHRVRAPVTVRYARGRQRAGEVFTVRPSTAPSEISRTSGVREYAGLWCRKATGSRIEQAVNGQAIVIADQQGERFQRFDLGGTSTSSKPGSTAGTSPPPTTISACTCYGRVRHAHAYRHARAPRQPLRRLSPDGAWLAYTKERTNYLSDSCSMRSRAARGRASPTASPTSPTRLLAGRHDALLRSLDELRPAALDMSSQERPRRVALYALVLAADGVKPPPRGSETRRERRGRSGRRGRERGRQLDARRPRRPSGSHRCPARG